MKIIHSKSLTFKPLATRQKTEFIVIHHTASGATTTLENIHRGHIARGFNGIGYHIYNRLNPDSGLWQCFYGRPLHTIGSHVKGHNSNSIGIAFAGNYEDNIPTPSMLNHVREVLAYFAKEYPTAKFAYHRIMRGASTACPGKHFIPELRKIAKELNLPIVERF